MITRGNIVEFPVHVNLRISCGNEKYLDDLVLDHNLNVSELIRKLLNQSESLYRFGIDICQPNVLNNILDKMKESGINGSRGSKETKEIV